MKGGDTAAVVAEWKRLAEGEPTLEGRGRYAGLALVFADLAGRVEVWRQGLEGWNVRRSQVVEEWRAEGRVEGRLEAARTHLLRVLQVRFGTEPPQDVVQAVQAQSDSATLDAWFDRALTAGSLDEMRAALGLPAAERNGGPANGN